MLTEQLLKDIDLEAKAEAKKLTARVPIFRHGYEAGWYDSGEKYAALWQAAEEKAARYEKLIEQLNNQTFIKGVPGATWGDTEYDSLAAAAGYNQAIMNMKEMILNTLTPKTGDDGR